MDFNQLTIFLVLAEELHFGRAAARLHMAQPPVSRAIAQLESNLGVKLFERSTRKVELTPIGVRLVRPAEAVIAAAQALRDKVQVAKSGDSGQIDIVFAGVSTHGLIGALSRELKRTYPGITPNFLSQNFAQGALDLVSQGEADIVFGRWDFIPSDIDSVVVVEEKLVLAVPVAHNLAGRKRVLIQELIDEPFIELNVHQSVLWDRLRRLAHTASFEPKTVQKAPDTWTALALVAAEIGVLLTIDSVANNVENENIRFIPIMDPVTPIQLRMAWRPGNTNPALAPTLAVATSLWQLGSLRATQ